MTDRDALVEAARELADAYEALVEDYDAIRLGEHPTYIAEPAIALRAALEAVPPHPNGSVTDEDLRRAGAMLKRTRLGRSGSSTDWIECVAQYGATEYARGAAAVVLEIALDAERDRPIAEPPEAGEVPAEVVAEQLAEKFAPGHVLAAKHQIHTAMRDYADAQVLEERDKFLAILNTYDADRETLEPGTSAAFFCVAQLRATLGLGPYAKRPRGSA